MSGCERALDLIGLRLDGPLSRKSSGSWTPTWNNALPAGPPPGSWRSWRGPSSSWVSAIPRPSSSPA